MDRLRTIGEILQAQAAQHAVQVYLTQCFFQPVLKSQLPHKIVNALFTFTN
jgi:hypothetical protein